MKNDKGFTLVEVLIAVAVMALITIIAFPSIRQFQVSNAKKKFKTYELTAVTAAKLYVDSYQEDLFGYNHTGCADISFKELEGANLLKKYAESNISCTKDSFIYVRKTGEKFSYVVNMKCVDDKNNVVYATEGEVKSCTSNEVGDNFSLRFGEIRETYSKEKTINVNIKDIDGLLENTKITYCLKKNVEGECVRVGTYNFKNKRGEVEVSFDYKTPDDLSGLYYLEIGTGDIRDVYGNSPSENGLSSVIMLDNTPPVRVQIKNDYEDISTSTPYSVICKSHDEHSGISHYQYRYPNSSDESERNWKSYSNSAMEEFVTTEFSKPRDEIVQIRACDKAGNCSEPGESKIKIITNLTCSDLASGIQCETTDTNKLINYTGKCEFSCVEADRNVWKIKFKTTGDLTLNSDISLDIFTVGGGGGGGSNCSSDPGFYCQRGGGGGGGYTKTYLKQDIKAGKYHVQIGAGGARGKSGEVSYFGSSSTYFANGGGGASNTGGSGGSGGGSGSCSRCNGYDWGGCANYGSTSGSGGKLGLNGTGCSGLNGSHSGGKGQGYTTCEFGLGTTSGCDVGVPSYSRGGIGSSYVANSGNGGNVGGSGSSGTVVIRNNLVRDVIVDNNLIGTYTGTLKVIDEGNGNWKIRFLSSGEFILNTSINVDLFLVGGGGGGGSDCSSDPGFYCQRGGGGGGGYTQSYFDKAISPGTYWIEIGSGGSLGESGKTSYFGNSSTYFANGGGGASNTGGNGGSGGGSGSCALCNGYDWGGCANYSSTTGKGGKIGVNGTGCSGVLGNQSGGKGQGSTTCEFGEGTTSSCNSGVSSYAQGGIGASSTSNTGNGGNIGNVGNSGIVIVRNKR